MTAIELQSELLREISPIAEDEGLMRKVIGYVRNLARGRDATAEADEEIRTNLRQAFAEFKECQEGRLELQDADDFLQELRTI